MDNGRNRIDPWHRWVTFAFCAACAGVICGILWWSVAIDPMPEPEWVAALPFLQVVTVVGGICALGLLGMFLGLFRR